jgi:hypothetical protein
MVNTDSFPRSHKPTVSATSSTERFSAHSHTMATRQPCLLSRATFRASRLTLLSNFTRQKSLFILGDVAYLQPS